MLVNVLNLKGDEEDEMDLEEEEDSGISGVCVCGCCRITCHYRSHCHVSKKRGDQEQDQSCWQDGTSILSPQVGRGYCSSRWFTSPAV